MLTVRVIIIGLIAIIPRVDSQNVTLLFVDSLEGRSDCENPAHIPFIATWGGVHCDGHCGFPLSAEKLDISTAIGERAVKLFTNGTLSFPDKDSAELNWIPVGRQVRIQDPDPLHHSMKLLGNDFVAGPVPANQQQVASWRWILPMKALAPGDGEVDGKCLRSPEKCKVTASLEIPLGTISSCHLLSLDYEHVVSYVIRNGKNMSQQAIADWALIEFSIPGNSVAIDMGCLGGKCFHEESILRPTGKPREITLLVANIPYDGSGGHGHLKFLASLLKEATDQRSIAVPGEPGEVTALNVFSDSCQKALSLDSKAGAETLLNLKFEAFLNRPECGPIFFRN